MEKLPYEIDKENILHKTEEQCCTVIWAYSPPSPLPFHSLQFLPYDGSESNTDQWQQSSAAVGYWNLLIFSKGSLYLQRIYSLLLPIFLYTSQFLALSMSALCFPG